MSEPADISLRALLEHAHVGIVIHRWDSRVVYANPSALQLLRLSYKQMIGIDAWDPQWNFIDEHNRRLHIDEYPVNKVVRMRTAIRNEVIGVVDKSTPEVSWFSVNAYPEGGKDSGDDGFIVVIFAEITSDKQRFSFRDIVERADDIVIVTEADDLKAPCGPKIVYVNPAFERLTGYRADEVIGETPRILQGSLTDANTRARIAARLADGVVVRETLLNYGKSGTAYWLDMNIVPLTNRFGQITHFAAIERNVSEQIFREEQLEKRNCELRELKENLQEVVDRRTLQLRDAIQKLELLAYKDPLTGIANRRSFLDEAVKQVARADRSAAKVLFGIIDLDHFKQVNDRHGHQAGDLVLVEVANCLARFFRHEDVFGRFGGEEFAFCLVLSDKHVKAADVGERLRGCIADVKVHSPDGVEITVTASIGIAVHSTKNDDVVALMKDADEALYEAKNSGRNRITVRHAWP